MAKQSNVPPLLYARIAGILYLIIKSKYFPGILGYGLITAAVVYLVGSFARFLLPDYVSFVEPSYIIPLIAEILFCLWLLFKGVRT